MENQDCYVMGGYKMFQFSRGRFKASEASSKLNALLWCLIGLFVAANFGNDTFAIKAD